MQHTVTLLLAAIAAKSALALPSHGHQHFHAKKEAEPGWQDVDYSKLQYTSFSNGFGTWGSWTPSATAPPEPVKNLPGQDANQGSSGGQNAAQPAAQPAVQAEKKVQQASGGSDNNDNQDNSSGGGSIASAGTGVGNTVSKALNNVGSLGQSVAGAAGGSDSAYTGNTGSPYGSNFALVKSAGDNQYTMTLKNSMGSTRRIVAWNKAGQDGQMTGFIPSANPPAIDINLAPGESQVVAMAKNTIGGVCDWTEGKIADKASAKGPGPGAYDCAWGEFGLADENNANKYMQGSPSGFDISNIISNTNGAGNGDCNISMTNKQTGEKADCNSHVYQHEAANTAEAMAQDSKIPIPINPGSVHLEVVFG